MKLDKMQLAWLERAKSKEDLLYSQWQQAKRDREYLEMGRNPALANFTSEQLTSELKARGAK